MTTVEDKLTQLLALAQSGEIVGVAVATVHKDGGVGSSWSLGTTTRGAVLGARLLAAAAGSRHAPHPLL